MLSVEQTKSPISTLLGFVRTNSPTSARHENGPGYIKIWATPPRRLIGAELAPECVFYEISEKQVC